MTAKIIDGKAIARDIQASLQTQVIERAHRGLSVPGLTVIQVGSDPASAVYVKKKLEACRRIGIYSESLTFSDDVTTDELLECIDALNNNPNVHGILVQLPLPKQIDTNLILESISPNKDVDGFHPYNIGRLAQRRPNLRPCTPKGVMTLLAKTGIDPAGQSACIVGASNIVGRPMALELLLAKATPTVAHRFTQNLADLVQQADILVVATGKRGVVDAEWIKPGATVIDVGIHRLENGKLAGDLAYEAAAARAGAITPVPGGVGPMTVASLMENTLQACVQLTG